MIAFDCLRCGDEYEVGDDQAGRVAPCQRCGTRLTVPAAGENLGSVGGFRLAPPPPVIELPVAVPPPAPSARRTPRPEPDADDGDTYGFGDKDDRRAPKHYPRDRDDDEPRRRPAPRPRYDDDDDEEPQRRPLGAPPAEPLLGVASLVLAGVSLLLALFAPYLGVVAAILAGGVGFLALKTRGKTLGLIGLCCAIVLLLVNSVLTVLWLAGGVPTKPKPPAYQPPGARFPRGR